MTAPRQSAPTYRYRGRVRPCAEVSRPVAVRRNAAGDGADSDTQSTSATVDIFDVIDSWGGFWGISAHDVDAALSRVGDVDTLYVRVNSPGGEANEGIVIANLLRAHPADVRVTVYGLAASAASYISAAGDVVSMAPGSMLMIHDAWNIVIGDADGLRAEAGVLDKLSDSIASLYVLKAGGTAAQWRDLMRAETWYTADDAVSAGLADRVGVDPQLPDAAASDPETDPVDDAELDDLAPFDRAAARFDLTVFAHPPTAQAATETPAASADGSTETQERSVAVEFTDEQLTTMRQQLGLPEDADAAAIVAAQAEALAEQAEPAAAASDTVPDGHVVISQLVLDELRENATAGAAARAQQMREDRDEAIGTAVREGRISAARRDHWTAYWDRDPEGARADLESLPVRFPVGDTKGHMGSEHNAADVWSDDEADALGALAGLPKGALR